MHVVTYAELGGNSTTCRFDGDENGDAPVSVLVVNEGVGEGPDLHKHAYHEVFVILEGEAEMRAGEETRRVGPGSIAVVEPETFHGFTVVGSTPLRSVHIHAAGHIKTTWKNS
jgi:mannose-6-phosphate isomerase-like protein (cupin superfamily)